jgi:ribA/ribD-fused uncharacterized protein
MTAMEVPRDPPEWFKRFEDKLSLLPNVDSTVKENSKQLSGLIKTVDFVSTKLDQACEDVAQVKKDNAALKASNDSMKGEISKLKSDMLYMESQMRRNNLLFDGLPEKGDSETWLDCENSLMAILKQELGHVLTGVDIIFDRVHRVGPKQHNIQKPRQVVAKFALFKQRDLVWNNRFSLQKSKLWVSEDYPSVIRNNRKLLFPIFQAAKRSKQIKSCSMTLDKLFINNKLYTAETIDQVPDFLKPENSSVIVTEQTVVFSSKFAVFSNLHKCKVTVEGREFNSTEQLIQFSKARLFNDEQCANKILQESDTFTQMMLGKKVRKFNSDTWEAKAKDILFRANLAKFSQNGYAREALVKTGSKLLGEATRNPIFGIGHTLNSKTVSDNTTWKCQNLMGEVLCEVREKL